MTRYHMLDILKLPFPILISFFISSFTLAMECGSGEDIEYICGVENAEDLLRIPKTSWVITSSMGDESWQGGGLYQININNGDVHKISPLYSNTDFPRKPNTKCPGPPEEHLFSAHGISLREGSDGNHRLLVVNHGGRESIEFFDVDVLQEKPVYTWSGCALLPEGAFGNSVAALPSQGFLITSILNRYDKAAVEKLKTAQTTGSAYEWNPKAGWAVVPNSTLSGNNGITVSDDGRWIFIAGWSEKTLVRLSKKLNKERQRKTVYLDFLPDNINWTSRGTLLVTGQNSSVEDVLRCNDSSESVCSLDYVVAEVNPQDLKILNLIRRRGGRQFGGATSAIEIGEELWVGTFRGNRIARLTNMEALQ